MNVPLVCDYGSGGSKVGFAGTEAPLAVFPTVLGKLRHDNLLVGMDEQDWFIRNEVQKNREKLHLLYPVSRAAVTSWDRMEKVLHVAPEQHPLVVTESPLNPMANKERESQILFETFCVPALYLANQGVLSLYASGQTSADRECVRDLKEKYCYVALNFDKEKMEADSLACTQKCQLPNGQEISLGRERFFCPEALFQPDLIGTGICSGLRFRLQREISALVSPKISVKVSTCPYSIYGAWVGGSILSSLSTFKDMWVTNEEYKDIGSSIIGRRSL